ncbi:hypothetical protein [Marinobacterium aestuariivivens]|uniref:Uncharacterized protein n=1 Tax=Marinobacterium aestuariivivens TaxID=1698799 RepID=A0ABW2A9A5_9GAMM
MISDGPNAAEIKTITQLQELFDIDPEGALSKANFSHPLKSYRLIKADAKCQYVRDAKVCGQYHQHGYIVQTKNGIKLLIGHCCAEKHFGINDDEVKSAFSHLRKTEYLQRRQDKARQFLSNRERLIAQIDELLQAIDNLYNEAARILELLPQKTVNSLIDRLKRNDVRITWEYSIVQKEKNEIGRTEPVTSWYPVDFGLLRGLGNWLRPRSSSLLSDVNAIRNQLDTLPKVAHLTDSELKAAEAVIKQLERLKSIKIEVAKQRSLIREFCAKDNLWLLILLTSNHVLRAETASAIHAILGEPLESTAARIVTDFDKSLREKYRASGLRIAS